MCALQGLPAFYKPPSTQSTFHAVINTNDQANFVATLISSLIKVI